MRGVQYLKDKVSVEDAAGGGGGGDRAQIVKLRKVACSALNISGTCGDTSIHRRIIYPTALC